MQTLTTTTYTTTKHVTGVRYRTLDDAVVKLRWAEGVTRPRPVSHYTTRIKAIDPDGTGEERPLNQAERAQVAGKLALIAEYGLDPKPSGIVRCEVCREWRPAGLVFVADGTCVDCRNVLAGTTQVGSLRLSPDHPLR